MLMNYDQIRHRLQSESGRVVARATGLGEVALSRLKRGRVTNPKYGTLLVLTEYFHKKDREAAKAREAEKAREAALADTVGGGTGGGE